MKKIFTLLFAVGMITMAQAQNGGFRDRPNDQQKDQRDDRRDNDFDKGKDVVIDRNVYDKDGRFDNKFMSLEKQRDLEIAQINRDFDQKIQKVKRSYFTTRFSKERQIRMLEQLRQKEISDVYTKYTHMKKNKNRRY